eukprot:m.293568 g.293568  ORF g.293568 m.293568 type:complete len:304 (-) comp12827_c0_seq1:242-1153(-)
MAQLIRRISTAAATASIAALEPAIPRSLRASARSIGGRKGFREDRLIAHRTPNCTAYAVFDGHAGPEAARLASRLFAPCLDKAVEVSQHPVDVVRRLFESLQHGLWAELTALLGTNNPKEVATGTTCTVVMITQQRVVVGHVGDSAAVLCRAGRLQHLTRPHHPDDPREAARIIAAGGYISDGFIPRVNGRLAMTRALGAFHLADAGVIATPEILSRQILAHDEYVVLGTDGLFDYATDGEILSSVASSADPNDATRKLVDLAYYNGSTDDISSIVVPLGAWSERGTHDIHHIIQRNLTRPSQ